MIKFEDVVKSKSLGMIKAGTGIGVSTVVYASVIEAKYAKDKDGKVKKSKAGNKQIKLNCKTTEDVTKKDGAKVKIPHFFNVTYYETEYSPKLKEIQTTDKVQKYAEVKFNTGGLGKDGRLPFGSFKIRNYEGQDGSMKTATSFFGGNVQVARKINGVYVVKDFDGKDTPFSVEQTIKVNVKGFIKPITDTETFIAENYNEATKRLSFELYYLENEGDADFDTTMPIALEGIERDRVMKFIEYVKNKENEVVGVRGRVKSYPIYAKTGGSQSKTAFGEFATGGFDVSGYEGFLVADYTEEQSNWQIFNTGNKGMVILSDDQGDEEEEDTFPF